MMRIDIDEHTNQKFSKSKQSISKVQQISRHFCGQVDFDGKVIPYLSFLDVYSDNPLNKWIIYPTSVSCSISCYYPSCSSIDYYLVKFTYNISYLTVSKPQHGRIIKCPRWGFLLHTRYYFKLLEFLGDAATIKNCFLSNSADILIMQIHHHLWSIPGTEAQVKITVCLTWDIIIVVFTLNLPGTMRGRNQYPLQYSNILLKIEIDIPILSIVLVSGPQLVLVRKITRHKREPNRHRKGQSIVTILERIRFL